MLAPALLKRPAAAATLLLALTLLPSFSSAQGVAEKPGPAETRSVEAATNDQAKPALIPITTQEERHEALVSAIWVIVIFLILLAILYPTAWKNVLAGLKAREDRIRKDLADAESARLAAERRQTELEQRLAAAEAQVRDIIAKGAQDAERIATTIKQQATDEAQAQRQRAVKEIEGAKNAALAEVYEQTADLATSIASKILRRNLNPNDQRDLVNQSLHQLQSLNS